MTDHATRRPDAVAVAAGAETLSYGELDARADRLAGYLVSTGAGPGSVIGVRIPRGAELVLVQLAVLRAGAAWLPLDPALPPARIAWMVGDAGATFVVDAAALRRIESGPARPDGTDRAATQAGAARSGGDIAYVVYTSGSTGRPKGVQVTAAGLANMVDWYIRYYELGPSDRTTLVASPGFDASVGEIWPTLCAGARLDVPDDDVRQSPQALRDWLVSAGITVTFQATPMAELLLAQDWPADGPLRVLLTAGDRLRSRPSGDLPFRLVNSYGPTETTMVATAGSVTADGPGLPSIGRTIDGIRAQVLDTDLRPVCDGEVGELCLGGVGLAVGYIGRADLTAERFVPDPSAATPGGRLYRTGDLVRRDADGDLHFVGRNDEQLEVRGHRVEPGEVEAALLRHPDVGEAGVGVAADNLIGYIAPTDPRRIPTERELVRGLKRELPAYMVPHRYVVLDTLPLTANGKVDRAALPAPGVPRGPFRPPSPGTQARLAEIWQEVLRVTRVGADDDFFALGGNSLVAARLAGRVRQEFDADLPLPDVFACSSLREMAARIDERIGTVGPARLPALEPGPPCDPVGEPVTYQQEQVWFLQRLNPDSLAYNAQISIPVAGRLDLEVLERALTELVARHEILRTTFAEVDGRLRQFVRPPEVVEVPVLAPEHLATELRRAFDPGELPLFRWLVLEAGDGGDHELVLIEHHFVHDGWSFTVLISELRALYGAFHPDGTASEPPRPPIQYVDYARWQRTALEAPALRAQAAYWQNRLADLPSATRLPADRPAPSGRGGAGRLLRIELPARSTAGLRRYARDRKATLFTVLLAAFCALLHRHTGETDICLGSGFANRRQPETERLPGMLVNTVVLRCDLAGRPDFDELVRRVGDVVREAAEHQEYPYVKLVQDLNPERAAGANPFYANLFSFNDAALDDIEFAGVPATTLERHNDTAKADLNVIVVPRAERQSPEADHRDDRITLLWEYDSDLFDEDTMRGVTDRFLRLLEGALADPTEPVTRLPLTSAVERDRLERWAVHDAGRYDDLLHERFARHAADRPDADAIVHGATRLTYAELNARADAVAAALVARGTGPDRLVGIRLPRGIELVVAMLGILKAGGGYLPLDPEHPPARQARLLADAGVDLVVTGRSTDGGVDGTNGDGDGDLPAGVTALDIVTLDAGIGRGPLPAGAPLARPRPDHVAYVLYTSGSTGRPKAVAVPHRGVVRLVIGQDYAGFGPDSVWLLHSSATFDASTFEIWGALANGGRLVIAPPGRLSTIELGRLVAEHGVTTLFLTTGLFNVMVDDALDRLHGVRHLVTGGEAASPVHFARARAGLPDLWLVNAYGPTEATVIAACRVLPPGEDVPASLPIGRPIAGTCAYVLDDELAPAPPGTVGELYLGGPGLARGYLGAPDPTAERFVPDPFGPPGGRLYRTGDLVRWTRTGELEFVGRSDDQHKVRGYRIEPGEVEAWLRTHPEVGTCHVAVRADNSHAARLVAYVVTTGGGVLDEGALHGHAARMLPEYLRPSDYVLMTELPLKANGKVDRGRLPEPVAKAGNDRAASVLEERIGRIWCDALAVDEIGVRDNFFDLGGHSLLVARVHTALVEALDRDIPLIALYEHPTVRALADHLAGEGTSDVAGDGRADPPPRRTEKRRRRRAGSGR